MEEGEVRRHRQQEDGQEAHPEHSEEVPLALVLPVVPDHGTRPGMILVFGKGKGRRIGAELRYIRRVDGSRLSKRAASTVDRGVMISPIRDS